MELFEIISLKIAELNDKNCKIHLAVWNGEENPFDVFLAGNFEEWQRWQSKRNFERKFIVSLIQLPGNDKWLFAGCYRSLSCEYLEEEQYNYYTTEEVLETKYLSGRLIVNFKRSGRQSYLLAENWSKNISVSELLPKKVVVNEFSGYQHSLVSKEHLDIIVSQQVDSWKSALSSVSGVYLITDRSNGNLYVGSATGEGGIWQRWTEYSINGHGGNKELVELLRKKGSEYSNNFQYSVLEISDNHADKNSIIAREQYWKQVLCSKAHGYNAN
ncbi:GIY-YIG nuclease family protein [Photobacterium damselae]|uniref:GIY-YIG nuclease family protein n=1 Tax=Photobacterium damselae TaxID=38293 RepID=UPI001594E755|nr:GIY-YIG nuclease family protein [Photobacterium damselae]NVH46544.1 GIY-YIG nuclease family protein [Photobacterium damselae subsp. damselae]